MSFSQNKTNPTSKIIQDLDAEQNVDTSRFWTRNPKSCNIHIYHFHVLELLNLDFSKFWGGGGGYYFAVFCAVFFAVKSVGILWVLY